MLIKQFLYFVLKKSVSKSDLSSRSYISSVILAQLHLCKSAEFLKIGIEKSPQFKNDPSWKSMNFMASFSARKELQFF